MQSAVGVEALPELEFDNMLETEPMETSESVEEYTDENGRRVKRVTKTTTCSKEFSSLFPGNVDESGSLEEKEPVETKEEFVNKDGVKITRVIKRTVVHSTDHISVEEKVGTYGYKLGYKGNIGTYM